MDVENTETNGTENNVTVVGTFDQIHTELRKVHNIRTPSGAVVKMDGDDKIWWAYFYTFSLTKRKKWCDFSLQKIADDHDVSTKTVTRNAKRLVEMGVLEVKPKEHGRGNVYITISIPELIAMKTNEKVTPKKTEEKQYDGKFEPASPGDVNEVNPAKPGCTEMQTEQQTEQAAAAATSSTDAPTGESADQSPDLASESAASTAGQRESVAFNNDSGDDDRADDPDSVRHQQTAGRVMAPLDHLRYWSYVGDDGLADYGVMWGVSGDGLDNLIGEHLKIREAEAEKNFKSQRVH